jgi:hypothetical protein
VRPPRGLLGGPIHRAAAEERDGFVLVGHQHGDPAKQGRVKGRRGRRIEKDARAAERDRLADDGDGDLLLEKEEIIRARSLQGSLEVFVSESAIGTRRNHDHVLTTALD